jgi:hypothetical protein
MRAKSFTALLILCTAMAAPGVENTEGEIRAGGVYSNDYVKASNVDAEWNATHLEVGGPGRPAAPAGDKNIKPSTPAPAPSAASSNKTLAGSAAPGGAPGSPSGAPKDAPKDSGKDKTSKDKTGKLVEKGGAADGFPGALHVEGGSYEHSEGSWGLSASWKDGNCATCKGGDKPSGPSGTSTSCSTDVASATPPPPPKSSSTSTPACPLASNGSTPCAAPRTPPTPAAKTPEGEARPPPPAQVGSGPSTTPASKPESPKSPGGAMPPPKSTPSSPAKYKSAAGAPTAAGPLAQMAVFGVVSYAVAALIL